MADADATSGKPAPDLPTDSAPGTSAPAEAPEARSAPLAVEARERKDKAWTRRELLRGGVLGVGALAGGRWLGGCEQSDPRAESEEPAVVDDADGARDAAVGRDAGRAAEAERAGDAGRANAGSGAAELDGGARSPAPDSVDARERNEDDAGHPANDAQAGPVEDAYEGPLGPEDLFQHGVASGDPLPDAVILWTRVSTADSTPVQVRWELARDPALAQMLRSGSYEASEEHDFTVKVDARELEPGQTYYYRFKALGRTSPVGRTRSAASESVAQVRFGVASCSSLAHGYFHAYRALAAERDLDAIIHLGDYIYEYGSGEYGAVRAYEPAHEARSLSDYRARHAQYKRDPDLQEAHRQHPFIAVWDDHESADNAYLEGAANHTSGTEGSWSERRAAAVRAYHEWLPVRDQDDPLKIWRKQAYGGLVDLIMLDTRLWGRTKQQAPENPPDRMRSLLGADQEAWFAEQLNSSQARWKLVGQQVMMASVGGINNDQWEGYPASRQRALELFRDQQNANIVVLAGDIHSAWANELTLADAGSVAVEFVAPSVTSPGGLGVLAGLSPDVRWADPGDDHGFMIIDVTAERVQASWFLSAEITSPTFRAPAFRTAWSVAAGERTLRQDAAPASAQQEGAPLAP